MSRANSARSRVAYIFVYIGVAFLIISAFYVYSGKEIDVSTLDGVIKTVRIYTAWLVHAFGNFIKITGYAIDQDWSMRSINTTAQEATKQQ